MENDVEFVGTIKGALDPRQHDFYRGQRAAREQFEKAFFSDRFPPAWALHGPEGVGKASFAWNYARQLVEFATIKDTALPIPTMERYARGSQTEIQDITLPRDDKGAVKSQIPVETIRALQERLSLSSDPQQWRAVIIDPAEAMNANAANALLKLLEEPPQRVVFFLISHAPNKLLPTILSRCQKLRFHPLSNDELREIWPKVTQEPPPDDLRIDLAEGSIGLALSMTEEMSNIYKSMVKMIQPPIPRPMMVENARSFAQGSRSENINKASMLFQLLFGRLAAIATGINQGHDFEHAAAQNLTGRLPAWAQMSQDLQAAFDEARRLNLDVEGTILSQWMAIDKILKT